MQVRKQNVEIQIFFRNEFKLKHQIQFMVLNDFSFKFTTYDLYLRILLLNVIYAFLAALI